MSTELQASGPALFGSYGDDGSARRSWLVATFGSTAIYVAIVVVALFVGRATKQALQDKPVDVTFVEKVVKEPPPPAPAPPPKPMPEVKPQAPAAAAPLVRPDQKIRKLDKPPPKKEMVAPREMPQAAPKEADPSQDKGVAVYGEPGQGDPAGLEGGVAKGGVVGGMVGGAIELPENAIPAKALASNPEIPYPAEAKAAGKTGEVLLKIVVLADGSVGDVKVLRGEEPFVSATVATIKKWKFEPARAQGQPISAYKTMRFPFKLTV